MERLKNNLVIVSLYVDVHDADLQPSEQYYPKTLDKQITTLGDKNANLQVTNYNAGASGANGDKVGRDCGYIQNELSLIFIHEKNLFQCCWIILHDAFSIFTIERYEYYQLQ